MTLFQRVVFALWFAWTDLFGRWRSLWVTGVNLGSVLALVASAVVVYGLVLGADDRQIKQFDRDPLAGCLVFSPMVEGKGLTKPDSDDLAAAIRSHLRPNRLRAASPFYRVVRDFVASDGVSLWNFEGRTLAANDPLLESFREADYWLIPPAAGPADVVIDQNMMKVLRFPPAKLPPLLSVNTRSGLVPVSFSGVMKSELPGGYAFLMPEAVRDVLRDKDRVIRLLSVRTGLLPAEWAKLPKPPVEVLNHLKANNIRYASKRPFGEGWVWVLESTRAAQAPRLDEWNVLLKEIAGLLEENLDRLDPQTRDGFGRAEQLDVVEDAPLAAHHEYHRVAVYLRHPDDLDPAIEAATAQGYKLEDDRHDQLRRIRRSTKRALQAWDLVLYGLAGLALCNIYAIQHLQAQQKRAEVGMLKAMGMTGWTLLGIYLCEAFLLWLPALMGGLLAGWQLGHAAEWWMSRDDPQTLLVFAVPTARLAEIIGVSFVVSLGSTLAAVWMPLSASPLECLAEP